MEALKWIGSLLAAGIVLAVVFGIMLATGIAVAIGGALTLLIGLLVLVASGIKGHCKSQTKP